VQWLCRMAWFDLDQIRLAMEHKTCATAGNRRRRAKKTPPIGNTGALPTGIVTGGLRIP
jgi:hypothetical protein